jgi:enterochelin esterase-like enzyme
MSEHAAATRSDSTTDQVKEQVTQKAEVAQEKARSRFRDQVDQRSTQAGERLGSTAADVRSVAEELRRQGKDTPARMVEQVAGQADRAADYLR